MVDRILYPAAVLAWVFHHHEMFPKGKDACHSCDNPRCVNPKHIWPGTHQENVSDCVAKGRARKNPDATARTKLAKPTCGKGHPRTPENTVYWGKSTHRHCRVCEAERTKRRNATRYKKVPAQ